jgi:hypothetical protein
MLHTSLLRNEYLEMPRLRLTLQLAHGSVAPKRTLRKAVFDVLGKSFCA